MATSTVELPLGLVVLGSVYIGITVLIGVVLSLMMAPLLVIHRRKASYFDDWTGALKAPWLFWHIGSHWYRIAELLGNYVLPAPQRVVDLASAYVRSQVVITINELGVPEALEHGPKTAQQLAAELNVHQEYLERILRVAERMGLVAITPAPGSSSTNSQSPGSSSSSQLYHLTQLSAVLCESHVNSMKHMVGLFGDHFPAFGHLAQGVKSGKTPYKLYTGGLSHWEHMTKQPELCDRFNKAMTNFNNLCPIEAVFLEYNFKQFSRMVDVGGGLGAFTAAAMTAVPSLQGQLFDLPNVIQQADKAWQSEHSQLLPRMSFASGSFFESGQVPPASSNSDVFTLRQILHDWSDAESIKILKQVRSAIGSFTGAKLLIVEACIASKLMTHTHTPRMCGDVHMLVQYGDAKERTEHQFVQLLEASGFRLNRILPTKSLFFVLEAVPM